MDAINAIFIILLTIAFISISTVLIISLGFEAKNTIPVMTEELFKKFIYEFVWQAPFNVCKAFSGRDVSYQDFQTLLLAASEGQCKGVNATVKLTFSLSKEDIKKITETNKIAGFGRFIFYNISEPLGISGLIIKGNSGYYPLKLWDEIEIWQEGEPDADTFIEVKIQGCDPYDDDCDYTCVFRKMCDPVCDDGKKHDVPCNLFCIDSNKNGAIDAEDATDRIAKNKCNPDCYSNNLNTFRAYDPGCVYKFKNQIDDVCDPNSNGVKDGLCDPDCARTKNICDPDCDSAVDDGNPLGVNDAKCWVCDKTCNGWCSPACKKDAEYPEVDPDCVGECDGNGVCNDTAGENCQTAPKDCLSVCSDQRKVCCTKDPKSDFAGCSEKKNLKEGGECDCGSQCSSGMRCEKAGYCCPKGKIWDGTACTIEFRFTMLYMPVQWHSSQSDFERYAGIQANLFLSVFPFKDCPKGVKIIKAWDLKDCGDKVSLHCENFNCPQPALQEIENCANTEYSGEYDRVIGLVDAEGVCRPNIGGWSCATMEPKPVVAAKSWAEVTAHELGHTYGLCDEYSGCIWDLQNSEMGCPNPKVDNCCDQQNPACSKGRPVPGGYCVMGPGGVPHPAFCSYCFDHLKSILKCS